MAALTFSVNIQTLTLKPLSFHLVATSEERLEISRRLSLLSIENLEAQLSLQRGKYLSLLGIISADVTQQCVRTLVPLPQHLDIDVDELFFPSLPQEKKEINLEEEELIEPLLGNILDVGEIVIQLLSLNLAPYPVVPESSPIEYHEENSSSSPFEILKKKK